MATTSKLSIGAVQPDKLDIGAVQVAPSGFVPYPRPLLDDGHRRAPRPVAYH